MAEDESSHHQLLLVVIDINPNQLLLARQPGALSQLLNCVLGLMNSHLMLDPRHKVALVAAHAAGCSFLYPGEAGELGQVLRQQDGQYEEFYQVETIVRQRVTAVLARDESKGHGRSSESLLSGAMAKGLAYVNKQQSVRGPGNKLEPRMLVLSATGDSAAQYMNYMNVFFTAQKLNIPVDTCMVGQDIWPPPAGHRYYWWSLHQGGETWRITAVPDLALPSGALSEEGVRCSTSCKSGLQGCLFLPPSVSGCWLCVFRLSFHFLQV